MKDNSGSTALISSSRYSNTYSTIESVRLLLEYNADSNLKDNKGTTALIIVCANTNKSSNIETAKLLLENGADPNLKDFKGWTALMHACRNSNTHSTIETVRILLEFKADPNLKDDKGWTALMLACRNSNTDSNIETVRILLEFGADPNLKDDKGWTALMMACRNINTDSNFETVELLLNRIDIDTNIICDSIKYNALMLLCEFNTNQKELAAILKLKTNLDHINHQNKKIEDLCLPEYKSLFIRNLDTILIQYISSYSECIICLKVTNCVRCEYNHTTCYVCLDKLNFRCEGCQMEL
jgi:ankyrin repeat protein